MNGRRIVRLAAAVGLATGVVGCEPPPNTVVQTGFRGTAAQYVVNPSTLADSVNAQASIIPDLPPPSTPEPPAPDSVFENVIALSHLSEGEFGRTMVALTAWATPNLGDCTYCHVVGDQGAIYAAEGRYTKTVARRMIQMVQDINANWTEHVGENGINCMTCHRRNYVPNNIWFYTDRNQLERAYLDRRNVRVQSSEALAEDADNRSSLKQTEWTYWLMLDVSHGLGVNCTHCHFSAHFSEWSDSPPQRVKALRGFEMTRYVNQEYLVPLQDVWPEERLGPLGDGPKLECATCHQGAYKPLYGHPGGTAVGWPGLHPPTRMVEADAGETPDSDGS